jgi:hypothetical protein
MTNFVVGSPARDRQFYGRTRELQTLHSQQWTWVCGQRRSGKTSLLFRLESDLRTKGQLPLYCNLEHLPDEPDGWALIRHFFETHDKKHLGPHGLQQAEFQGPSAAAAFGQLFTRLQAAVQQEVVLLWDEAEHFLDVAAKDPDFFKELRTIELPDAFRCVLAASQSLAALFDSQENADQSFLTRFRWLPLAGLEDPDARALLQGAQTGGWPAPLDDRLVSDAIAWTGGHPFLLQELGQTLEQAGNITFRVYQDCRAALGRDQFLRELFHNDFSRLTAAQQAVMKLVCAVEEGWTLDQLENRIRRPEKETIDAVSFLMHYGYVFWADQVRLRVGFYRDLLPETVDLVAPPLLRPIAPEEYTAKVTKIRRDLFTSDREAGLVERFARSGPKRILALDGGGIRGALTLGFLERIEQILRKRHGRKDLRLCEYFDLIGGTSTGAIIAAALAQGDTVEEVKTLYLELGRRVFGRRRWWWQWLSAKWDERVLRKALKEHFNNAILGDATLQTGLCIFIKRADRNETVPLFNHPHGRFYARRRGILLREAVRASTAAPTYFLPEQLEIGRGDVGVFVDGGLSMVNNPALYLFLMATLRCFPFRWATGEENLLLVSVGTGSWYQRSDIRRVMRYKLWNWAAQIPAILMDDASLHNQLLLQYLAQSPIAQEFDDEFGRLEDDNFRPAQLHYVRYNQLLDKPSLTALQLPPELAEGAAKLREMDAAKNCEVLVRIGAAAADQVLNEGSVERHFPSVFDLPPQLRADSA